MEFFCQTNGGQARPLNKTFQNDRNSLLSNHFFPARHHVTLRCSIRKAGKTQLRFTKTSRPADGLDITTGQLGGAFEHMRSEDRRRANQMCTQLTGSRADLLNVCRAHSTLYRPPRPKS